MHGTESDAAPAATAGRAAPDLEKLWAELSAAAPRLFLMRGTSKVPGAWSARGTDLDVLADDPDTLDAATTFLTSLGFVREWAPEAYLRRYCLRRPGSHLANVDLYEAALWGPGVAAQRPARQLSASEAALLRAVFDKHDLAYFRARARSEELPPQLGHLVAGAQPNGRSGAAYVAAGLLLTRQVRLMPDVIRATLARRFARFHSRGSVGLEVAVVGPDGSGKTTLVRGLTELCPLPFEVVYMGGKDWRLGFMRRVAGKRGSTIPRHLEQALRRLHGWRAARAGRIALYERHPHELEPGAGHPLMRVIASGLFATYSRPVDMAFVLSGDVEVMFARKGEHSPEALRRLDERARVISEKYSREYEVLDSTVLSSDDLTAHVASLLIEKYQRLNHG
jgi:hypothetical protein